MKKVLLILGIVMPLALFPQTKVLHYNQLSDPLKQICIPDVAGYVLLNGDPGDFPVMADSIGPYPGWPVTTVTGNQKLGGTYENLTGDEKLEILFTIGQKIYAWMLDGTPVPGWPVNLTYYPDGPPAVGDIDGDGITEIVVATRSPGTANSGNIFAFEHDGTVVSGFPVSLGGGPTNTTCLADVDGDGMLDILVTERDYPDGKVGIYRGDGTALPGWPQPMDYIPGSAVAAADVDNDGIMEVFAESYYQVWGWKADGTVMTGWPYLPGTDRVFSYSTPVIADINQDGIREIIVGDHSLGLGNGKVHVIKPDGTALTGWPRTLNYWIYSPCSVGDIDNDGHWDIATGDQVLSGSPVDELAAWNASGNYLPGFPVTGIDAINIQVLICNLDDDARVEIMIDDNTASGLFHVYNHDGSPLTTLGYPLQVVGQSFYINPFVEDLNKDDLIEICAAGYTSASTQTSVHLFGSDFPIMAELSYTTTVGFNTRHDGLFTPPTTVNISELQDYGNDRQLQISPDPSEGPVTLTAGGVGEESVTIRIASATGKILFLETVAAATLRGGYQLDLSSWPSGMYILIAETENEKLTGKFLLQ